MEYTTRFELQSQATRLVSNTFTQKPDGGVTLYAALFQGTQTSLVRLVSAWKKHNSAQNISPYADSQGELFPLHSPLLGESWLVSFPRFNDMLKFNRYSYFIWDPKTNERTDPLRQCVSTVVPSFILTMRNHLCTEYNTVVQTTIHLLMFTNDWSRMLCQNHKQFNSANIHAAQSYICFIAVNEWQQQ